MVLQEIYESFSRGVDGLQKINPRDIEGSCPDQIGKMLENSKKGRIDEASCQRLADCLGNVYEMKRLGDICRRAGLYNQAIRSYNRALSLGEDRSIRPVLLNNLGQAYAGQGDLARAAVYYQKAASGFEAAGDHGGMAHVLGNLGSACRRGGEWDRAIEHSYRSLKIFEELGDDLGVAQMTGALGRIYADMGERDLSARYFERSLADFQRLGDKKSAAWVLDRLGRIECDSLSYDKALGYFNQSLALFEEQAQTHSAGVVLSSMGRMYLMMGEATAACESLERALNQIPKGLRPAYQNALGGLAAAYSILAQDLLKKAEAEEEANPGSRAASQSRDRAAGYFAKASDLLEELAANLKQEMPEIRAASAIAKGRSYLARISAESPEKDATALAQRAIAALEAAISSSEGQEKAKVEGLRRVVLGMKEIWSVGPLENEPWKVAKMVASARENLAAGACLPGEANVHLGHALQNLGLSTQAQGEDMAEKLSAAASDLHQAEMIVSLSWNGHGRDGAAKISRAARILEELSGAASGQNPALSTRGGASQPNLKPERDALLLLGSALAERSLQEIDSIKTVYQWDESLQRTDGIRQAKGSWAGPARTKTESSSEGKTQEASMPTVHAHESPVHKTVFDDDSSEIAEYTLSGTSPDAGWLVPVSAQVACSSKGQAQLLEERASPVKSVHTGSGGPGSGDSQVLIIGPEEDPVETVVADEKSRAGGESDNLLNALASFQPKEGVSGRSRAIELVRALSFVAVLLLAIEVILYLI